MEDHENKSLINQICVLKQEHPTMPFLTICQEVDLGGDDTLTSTFADVMGTLYGEENTTSNLIVNTLMLMRKKDGEKYYRDLYLNTFDEEEGVMYKNLNLEVVADILDEFESIDFMSEELHASGFEISIDEDTVLWQMLTEYLDRRNQAEIRMIDIDKSFYKFCIE